MIDPLHTALARARIAFDAGDATAAFRTLEPFASQLPEDERLALAWSAQLIAVHGEAALSQEIARFAWHWGHHPDVMVNVCRAAVAWGATRPLDARAPDDDPVVQAAQALRRCLLDVRRVKEAAPLFLDLAVGLTAAGARWDDDALSAYEQALDLDPASAEGWSALGRHHLLRRRFDKALQAATHAGEIGSDPSATWVRGVAATALGDFEVAAAAWRALGHDVGRGDDGLPLLDLPTVEVVLSARLSRLDDGPAAGGEAALEVVWVKPHSPCHGRVVTPTVHALPADFDDRVLWDAAPLGFRPVQGREVPRFSALAVLGRGRAATHRFVGRQPRAGALAGLGDHLPPGCFVYVHDEQVMGGRDTEAVSGKVVAPRDMSRETLAAHLAAALPRVPGATLELSNPT